ncbi:MAG: TraR/DksA family transcriptional regulator [Endomicrobium sp.]|nr:TraR/DksA family transcriptional regulator [Endomicrobium sp.]
MNRKDLENFKRILLQKKIRLLNKTGNLQIDLDTNIGDEIDAASRNSEKEIYFELAANDKIVLYAVNDALIKIGNEVYGKCEYCNNVIPVERLKAIPWTRYCIKCQEKSENLKTRK